jgi:hypothetical protein
MLERRGGLSEGHDGDNGTWAPKPGEDQGRQGHIVLRDASLHFYGVSLAQ